MLPCCVLLVILIAYMVSLLDRVYMEMECVVSRSCNSSCDEMIELIAGLSTEPPNC